MRPWWLPRRAVQALTIIAVLGVGVAGFDAALSELEYSVNAANYTDEGIVIVDLPLATPSNEIETRFLVTPGLPTIASEIDYLGVFAHRPNSLPEELTIKWKAAKLSNCEIVRRTNIREHFGDDKTFSRPVDDVYFMRWHCDWSIDDSKVYSKTIDMAALRESAVYKKAADFQYGCNGQVSLEIELMFWAADDLEFRTSNSRTLGCFS